MVSSLTFRSFTILSLFSYMVLENMLLFLEGALAEAK